jgi:hypothetical protein
MSSSKLSLQNNHSDVREQGSGWVRVFIGLPFFFIGLCLVSYALGFNPVQIENSGVPLAFLWVIGLPFLGIGFLTAFGNERVRLDRRQGTITTSSGILFFVRRRKIPLQAIRWVQFDYIPGSSETAKSFSVRLILQEPYGLLPFYDSSDYCRSLSIARDLCRFLDKPLEDISGGQSIMWEPAYLEENLRDRARRLGEDVRSLPARPAEMQTQIRETWDGVVLEIPSPWSEITKVIAPINERLANTRVTASAEFLRIEGRASTNAKSGIQNDVRIEIPVTALHSLNVATALSTVKKGTPRRASSSQATNESGENVPELALSIAKSLGSLGITAQSETEFIQFGIGLPEEEAVYIHALLKNVLTR